MSRSEVKEDTSGTSQTEAGYFNTVSEQDDSMDQSTDSLQGSLSLPTFTMDHSNVLQGSHGFQVFHGSGFNPEVAARSDMFHFQLNPGASVSSVIGDGTSRQVMPGFENLTSGTSVPNNTLIYTGSQLGASTVLNTGNNFHVVLPKETQDKGQSQFTKIAVKTELDESDNTGGSDNVEGGSSDEKSAKCKTSPTRKGRKSRSTSSSGYEVNVKSETVSGSSPNKMDISESQTSSDIKPSLLDEILTEKKMALMRSPEVIRFLQTQQQLIEKEKKITHSKSMDS
ncbi:hypothetical protein ACF0H5_010846 [Mactra antiquata]